MLEPDSRSLLSELLRPPSGFTLSHAVGTTFTLTLEAALAVPLSLAGSGGSGDDTAGILSAVRRSTDRIDLFAQAGYIGLGAASDLVAVLEPMIHPVSMPAGRLFHPKVWFLEFASGDERRYRFVCSSRNLTTDRTWDAVVALDGHPGEAADEANDDMVRMLRWLASDGRTTPQLPGARRARLLELAESWRSIRWEHPEHVRRVAVHVLGIGGHAPPVLDGIRALIVSPFVTDSGLARLRARPGRPTTLVSRPEQLDRLAPASFDHLSMHVLDEFVDQALADAETETGTAQATGLVGLHAKMMVHDRAMGGSTVFLGSANATGPAWVSNVEVMVQLDGPTKQLGVDAITQSLAPLLDEYETEGGATASEDEAAERDLDSALRTIATARLTLRVHPGEPYAASLWAADPVPRVPDVLSLSWRLLTRTDARDGTFPTAADPHLFESLALAEITPFVVVSLTDSGGRLRQSVVIAEIMDDVPGRQDAIVAAHLTQPGAFARFIRLMLQQAGPNGIADASSFSSFRSTFGGGVGEDGSGLLELLVRAAATNADALADIERVLSHLSPDERSAALPAGFSDVWASVVAALDGEASRAG